MREEVEMRGQGKAGERGKERRRGARRLEDGEAMGEMGVGQNGRQGRDRTERKRVRQ